MGCCCIEITGKDGKKHVLTTDAASVFDAVHKAIQRWSKLWWWDPDVIAVVKRNDDNWNVSVKQVVQWVASNRRR